MSALAHNPDTIRRLSRLTRAKYHADQGERNFRAALAELDDLGLDWDIKAAMRQQIERLVKRFEGEIEAKGEERE